MHQLSPIQGAAGKEASIDPLNDSSIGPIVNFPKNENDQFEQSNIMVDDKTAEQNALPKTRVLKMRKKKKRVIRSPRQQSLTQQNFKYPLNQYQIEQK